MADWPPVPAGQVSTTLAGLADQSLLIAIAGPTETRYRALETVRQYGVDRLDEAGESVEALSHHLSWCLDETAALDLASDGVLGAWRTAFDEVADELRGALAWASRHPRYRPEAYLLAMGVAKLSFLRGMPGESQRRYEQAAGLAADDAVAADALRSAAGAAESRHVGDDALGLRLRAADRAGAACDLARNAELINRGPGLMATEPAAGEAVALIARGWALADGDLAAQARLLTADR